MGWSTRVFVSKIACVIFIFTRFALRYPNFSTDVVVSSPIQRVMDSSYFFAQGFFGLKTENVTFRTVTDLDDPVSWIIPWRSCPRFSLHGSHQVIFVARVVLYFSLQYIYRRLRNGR